MYDDVLTEDELRALLGEEETEMDEQDPRFSSDERKLLHALVRNQLRLLHRVEELQSELRSLKAAALSSEPAEREAAAHLEPLPLPFMKQQIAGQAVPDEQQEAPPATVSRKERYKRTSFW